MKIDAYLVDDLAATGARARADADGYAGLFSFEAPPPSPHEAAGDPVDDEMLRTLAVVAEPDGVLPALVERFGGAADRVGVSALSPGVRAVMPSIVRAASSA